MNRKSLSNGGFTLVEVLASVTIFAAAATGLGAATLSSMKANLRSRQLTAASALAHDKIEQLRSLDGSSDPVDLQEGLHFDRSGPALPSQLGAPSPYERRWNVKSDTPRKGMSLVTVSVTWPGRDGNAVTVETYVCRTGKCT